MIIGQYVPFFDLSDVFLHVNVKAREMNSSWTKCGLISNFIASYATFSSPSEKSILNSLSVITNELIENAVKYYFTNNDDTINILVANKDEHLYLKIKNRTNAANYAVLQNVALDLIDSDKANDKYFEKLRSIVPNQISSGIGLLMIISFFKVQMSFQLQEIEGTGLYDVSVQVKIDLKELKQ
ncbi:MAG: hypothetical protein ACRCUT_07760 [Spirochaetota bacterium]